MPDIRMRPITAGSIHVGDSAPLLEGKVQSHTLGFVHHRASGRYLVAWAEPTAEGPSRILFSSSTSLLSGSSSVASRDNLMTPGGEGSRDPGASGGWEEPRVLHEAEGPVEMLELASGGGTEVPRLFLTWYLLVGSGQRRPLGLLMSDDGGRTWDGPHRIRMDAPYPASGAIPPMEPSGGPGSEHLLHTFVPATTPGQPAMWAVLASDRFVEWSLALRPWQGDQWGNSLYLGLRHHMPLPAFMAETPEGLTLVYLRSPADFPEDVPKPSWPQATVVQLDLTAAMKDHDDDG
ncbi:MAG: hypothetical protein ACYCW6_10910, partial [Candidatus Xenobia bacterium]